jgi:S-formylglutathione hydrolase FrmB
MAFINLSFFSETLGRNVDINAIVPQRSTGGDIGISNRGSQEKYKTLLLLHGLSDDNTIWYRRTSIERYAVEHGIAVVMPSADRSFYTDMKHGDKYFTFISQEVLRVAREFLPLSDKREDTFVAGNSMGGYGAFKVALKNPDKFSAAIGLSSVADVVKFMKERSPHLMDNVFGESVPDSENLFYLFEQIKNETLKPRIYSCVGKGDYMYEDNVKLSKLIEKSGCDYSYVEEDGAHNWEFWDEHIQNALKWLFNKE